MFRRKSICDGHDASYLFDQGAVSSKGTSRQRSGKGAIRKRFPLQKPRWEKTKLTIKYLYHETYRKPNEQLAFRTLCILRMLYMQYRTYINTDGVTGWMRGQTDRQTDRQTDGRADRHNESFESF